MKKTNFFRHFVETLSARSLLGMLLLAPMGASAQVTIGSGDLPQATLDIIRHNPSETGKAFRLDDGNQAPGKILTCGENGVGTWQYAALPRIVGTGVGTLTLPFADMGLASYSIYTPTGASIVLPPGEWEVRVTTLLYVSITSGIPLTANNTAWVRTSFADTNTPVTGMASLSPDMVGNKFVSASTNGVYPYFSVLSGTIIVTNTSGADKTYYQVAGGITTHENLTEANGVIQIRTEAAESSIIATLIQQ